MDKEDRNIYIFTPAGWQHLETGETVESGGIRLEKSDIEELKALHLEREKQKEKGVIEIES